MNQPAISPRQFMFIVIFFTIGSSILIVPSPIASAAKHDAWVSVLLSILVGASLVLFYILVWKSLKGKSFVQACTFVFGAWLGRLFSFFYLAFLYILSALVLRNIGDFMTTQIIPETPLTFIHLFFLLVVIVGCYLGVESIGRSAEIFMPWMILLFLFLIFSITPQMNMDHLRPFFDSTSKEIIDGSTVMIGTPYLEMVALLMVIPYVKESPKTAHGWFIGSMIGGGFLFLITILSLLVLGSDLTSLNAYPTYNVAEKINIAGFMEGLEIIIAIIWMITIFFKLTVLYYASSVGIAQFLNIDNHRILLLPLGMGMIVLSLVAYPDMAYYENFVADTWLPYAVTHGFLLPLFLWGGLQIKNRAQKNTL
ncbi:GerAB/ArcD/ProY family transporter [Halobacillus kuroshimensis]|uniref:GerAB/ArcD/ProY family transporter n=1 Tax=Halobacillus kuroshimensis TaxID=302481 RepID=UPI00042524B2|nr:endospore germination permease [Halobacillus kuroshimensis]